MDFSIEGDEESKVYKMLIPLGYQFEADLKFSLIQDETVSKALDPPLTEDDVVKSYEQAVNTPPLNISRKFAKYICHHKVSYISACTADQFYEIKEQSNSLVINALE